MLESPPLSPTVSVLPSAGGTVRRLRTGRPRLDEVGTPPIVIVGTSFGALTPHYAPTGTPRPLWRWAETFRRGGGGRGSTLACTGGVEGGGSRGGSSAPFFINGATFADSSDCRCTSPARTSDTGELVVLREGSLARAVRELRAACHHEGGPG